MSPPGFRLWTPVDCSVGSSSSFVPGQNSAFVCSPAPLVPGLSLAHKLAPLLGLRGALGCYPDFPDVPSGGQHPSRAVYQRSSQPGGHLESRTCAGEEGVISEETARKPAEAQSPGQGERQTARAENKHSPVTVARAPAGAWASSRPTSTTTKEPPLRQQFQVDGMLRACTRDILAHRRAGPWVPVADPVAGGCRCRCRSSWCGDPSQRDCSASLSSLGEPWLTGCKSATVRCRLGARGSRLGRIRLGAWLGLGARACELGVLALSGRRACADGQMCSAQRTVWLHANWLTPARHTGTPAAACGMATVATFPLTRRTSCAWPLLWDYHPSCCRCVGWTLALVARQLQSTLACCFGASSHPQCPGLFLWHSLSLVGLALCCASAPQRLHRRIVLEQCVPLPGCSCEHCTASKTAHRR